MGRAVISLVGLVVHYWDLYDDVLRPYAAIVTESKAEDPRFRKNVVHLTCFCPTNSGTGIVQETFVPYSIVPKAKHWTKVPR